MGKMYNALIRIVCYLATVSHIYTVATDNCRNPLLDSNKCVNLSLCPPAGVNLICTLEYDPVCGESHFFRLTF